MLPELCNTQYNSFPSVQREFCHLPGIAWWVDNLGFSFVSCFGLPQRRGLPRKEIKEEKWRKIVQEAHDGIRVREYCIDVILCPAGIGHNKGRAVERKRVVIH